MSVRARVVIVSALALAVALLVVGCVLWATAGPTTFGWFAYAPLPEEVVSPGFTMLTPGMQVALGLAAAGLVLLAGLAGFWIGRRVSRGAPH
jgi:heme/copper-type cytochrome/quinol oxidase subunit 1